MRQPHALIRNHLLLPDSHSLILCEALCDDEVPATWPLQLMQGILPLTGAASGHQLPAPSSDPPRTPFTSSTAFQHPSQKFGELFVNKIIQQECIFWAKAGLDKPAVFVI
jgi:hypothetical protein